MTWPMVALGEVASIERNSIDPSTIDAGTAYVGLENIEKGGDNLSFQSVDPCELASSKFVFDERHVLFGKLRPNLCKVVTPKRNGICSTDILPVSPGKRLSRDYLLHFLKLPSSVEWATRNASGANLPRLSPKILETFPIPLPPLDDQKRIAGILDRADALRRKRRDALALLDTLTQSIFVEMFGDPVSNPMGHDEVVMGDVVHSASDGPHVSPKYSETGIPFISTRHVKTAKIVWEDLKFIDDDEAARQWKKCKPEYSDILYTKGGTTGIAALVDVDFAFAVWVHVALLKPIKNKVLPLWLVTMLNNDYCYRQSQDFTHGVANRDLGLKRMVNIRIYLPTMVEQQRFVHAATALERLRVQSTEALSKLESLFASLQSRAFSGKL